MKAVITASLRSRLYLLILIVSIPGCALLFHAVNEQQRSERDAILNKAMMIARAAASEENQQVESARHLLAAMVALVGGTQCLPQELVSVLHSLLNHSPGYCQLGILSVDGHVSASAPSMDPSTDFGSRNWFVQAVRTGYFAVGNYKAERVGGQPVLYFAMPVMNASKQVTKVIFAALNLNWMNRSIPKFLEELPKGSVLALVDADGDRLVFDPQAQQWVLQANRSLRDAFSGRASGTEIIRKADGASWIEAFASVSSTVTGRHAYVVLEIPQQLAFAGSRRIFWHSLWVMGTFIMVAVAVSWWASDLLILRPVRAILGASQRIAAGDLDARAGPVSGRNELSELAHVFDNMAAALEMRESRERQAREKLDRSREQLRNLASYLQNARETERTRIAREIHDDFGQSLTILKMDLSWLNSHLPKLANPVQEKLDAMGQVIDGALRTLHNVSAELRPVILDDFGLAAAIEWQSEEFQNRTGIHCQVHMDLPSEALPKEMATAVFRIFQEALTNVMRHAAARHVAVHLTGREDCLVLEVLDDGRGITQAEINNARSFGLIGIRERLYPWNGTVEWAGGPGQGTRLTVAVPLPAKGDAL